MTDTVMIDGQLVAADRACVSVFDRGFLYGDSVFESLRTYGGVPFALDEHLARFQRSAERVLIPLPVTLDRLRAEIESALASRASVESYLRLMLTRGVGRSLGLDPELAETPRRVLLVSDLIAPRPEIYERGVAAVTYRAERPCDVAAVSAAKTGNYLLAVLALQRARAQGASEALIEDHLGNVLEGATSNLFAVSGGELRTAPDTAAILPGITRACVLELARARGMPVALRSLSRAELGRADEVFVCSSLRELVPIISIDGRPIGAGVPGPISRALLEVYRAAARVGAGPTPSGVG